MIHVQTLHIKMFYDYNDSVGSDSDVLDDTIRGNVTKYSVIPPDRYGNLSPGFLIFDACFESGKIPIIIICCIGNLGKVELITEYEYDLYIRPDTCNPKFRVWFNFTVENVKKDQVCS